LAQLAAANRETAASKARINALYNNTGNKSDTAATSNPYLITGVTFK
jgi:hypothetical protein